MKYLHYLQHRLSWFLINLLGLSTALACVIASFIYIQFELSYDTQHTKADRIYRITRDSNDGVTSNHPARVYGDWPVQLSDEFPEVEDVVRLVPFRKAIVKIGDQIFFSKKVYATDSSFFKLFDFKVIAGNPHNALTKPGRVFITRSLAIKYFGSLEVIGKEVILYYQMDPNPKPYIIDGILEDFPENAHFHAEILTSFSPEDINTWAYTYLLLKKGTNAETLRHSIQLKWKKEHEDNSSVNIPHLQKITEIHLYSHKEREMEKNGDIRSIILLASGALVILLIALINYMNLNRVQFISDMKYLKIRMIIGASRFRLATQLFFKSLLLSLFSFFIGWIIAIKIGQMMGSGGYEAIVVGTVILMAGGTILTIACISVLPIFTSRFSLPDKNLQYSRNIYATPLIIQFVLSVIAIIGTIGLYRQMNYMRNLHPASQNANMLVIYDNPRETLLRYEVFKNELLKNPSVLNITGAMEEPGGEILDKCPFEMEGIEKKEDQWLNLFPIDPVFFHCLDIQPLAGTIDMGVTPTQQWEADVMDLYTLQKEGNGSSEKIAALKKKIGNPRGKYILNRSALKMLGISNPQDAIGKTFRLNFFIPELMPEGEIVGVVPEFHYTNLYQKERPLAMLPLRMFNYCFIIRIDPSQRQKAIAALEKTWKKVNPDYPLEYEYITDHYQSVYATEYSQSRVLSLFALISIIISSLGIFALAAFAIQRRTKEIGIRKVNGARTVEIMLLLNRNFILWGFIAFIIACPLAWWALSKWLENFAYKTTLSWWIFAVAGMIACIITLITVSWQTWKSASKNPVEALRYE